MAAIPFLAAWQNAGVRLRLPSRCGPPLRRAHEKARGKRNAVHLSGAALRFTGKRVFDIFTALG
ncbi:hypothetical protein ACK3YW_04570, partial [Aeromonas caviae]